MRLVCLHSDTVDALKRLRIQFDDLTPSGLWSSQYHLVGLTRDQYEALDTFGVQAEDVTPAQLAQAVSDKPRPAGAEAATGAQPGAAASAPGGGRPPVANRPETPAPTADAASREPAHAAAPSESEVPLAQARDTGAKAVDSAIETRAETKPNGKATPQVTPIPTPPPAAQAGGTATAAAAQPVPQKGGKGSPQATVPQGQRKGQSAPPQAGGGHRYGTTRLRISVAGKYTEATVANGKIVIGSRSFDSPDQAAAELTKSRGDWTFWEYYDSTDGKWRMLTRDWDTVLKSAAPGGR